MRDVQIIRRAAMFPQLTQLRALGQHWIAKVEAGQYRYARYYDDLWPLNISGVEGIELPYELMQVVIRHMGRAIDFSTPLVLCTTRYPYLGQWHQDAPPYEDDTICLLCVDGLDELEYMNYPDHPGRYDIANLRPGDLCLLPAAARHRGRCSTHRITWHVRVGPQGRTMPASPPSVLPLMTVRRFIRRTVGTACYYLYGDSTPWRKS